MAAIDWSDAEGEIVKWVHDTLDDLAPGLTVLWAYQSGVPFPDPPVVVLHLVPAVVENGSEASAFDSGADPGEEYVTTLARQWVVSLVGEIRTANSSLTGDSSPAALGTALLTALRLGATQERLAAAGLGFLDDAILPVDPVELFKNTWQPRIQFVARFYCTTTATSAVGFFDTARVTASVDGDAVSTVDVPLEATP